ncbi:helix-turn-helix domain-containing protein [Rathayibacter tanaceti]|uniref:Helix-turn-helix protein n=2 Tax=Rathayibacter tanaceti TaxID=1671680 RepID=A0ACD2XLP2_9MICO|nr:helix-turn-helix domain-containing protein [Rathayibacter tanaceti]KZX21454.1 hypothetical protein ACH61_01415 [Rathayibacter tanaceti]TCO38038.1 helix-turn-helix protein [Rathayibacter tanaceti]
MRARELGAFLRARRAALNPATFGVPVSGAARRVPGLRRREVAEAAAISVEYYTRIEQGRMAASGPVLADLARVLRLTDAHRAYLFDLAGKVEPTLPHPRRQVVQAPLQRALDDLATTPAFVLGRRTDVIGWNRLGAALITDFAAVPEDERTFIWLLFAHPGVRSLYADWQDVVELAVAQLRRDSARYPDDPELARLVERLSAQFPEFIEMWTVHEVAGRGTGRKTLHHPLVGELVLDWEILASALDPDQQIVLWTAEAGSESASRLRRLADSTRAGCSAPEHPATR